MIEGRLGPQGAVRQYVSAGAPWFAYGLLSVILLNYVQNSGHDLQRILEVLFLCGGGLALSYLAGRTAILAHTSPGVKGVLAFFFGAGIISSAFALSPVRATYEVGSLLLLLLMALAAADGFARNPAALPRAVQMFGVIAALYTLKIVAVYISVWISQIQPGTGHFTPGFDNFRHFNHAETVGLPLLMLAWLLAPRGSRLRWLWMATAAVWWAVLYLTAGRGSMVGLAAGCVALLAARGRSALPVLRAMLVSAIIGAAVYVLFFVQAPKAMGMLPFGELARMVERSVTDPSSGRTYLWKLALSLIEAHPWLGVGPLHFAHEGAQLRFGAHPHDWILQVGAEWGLPALIALCTALALAGRGLLAAGARVDKHDRANQDMVAAWVLIGAAVLVDGLVSGSLVMPQSQLVIALYIGCAAGWTWSRHPHAHTAATRAQGLALSVIAIAAVAALAYGVAPQFTDKLANRPQTAAEAKANGTEVPWPRQWLWGYF
jgi:O-antigen ligase